MKPMNALFVANFPSNTGYAWDTIETVFAGVARKLTNVGHVVYVAYASLAGGPPGRMQGIPVQILEYDYMATAGSPAALVRFIRLLRTRRIQLLYLTDQPTWSVRYLLFRIAGVRRIIVHDRTSGARSSARSLLPLKRMLHRSALGADRVIAVSQFVAARLRDVNGTDPARTLCIYNGIELGRFGGSNPAYLREATGIPAHLPIIFCAGRANRYKGIDVLIRAVAALQSEGREVALVVCGDGPDLPAFRSDAERLDVRWTRFLGKRTDIPSLLAGATICAVPSVWAEAFGLTVVEAMAAGKPVVATRTGGIPELIDEGGTGLLVTAGDAAALAEALRVLLDHDDVRCRMGRAGRAHAVRHFSADRTIEALAHALAE